MLQPEWASWCQRIMILLCSKWVPSHSVKSRVSPGPQLYMTPPFCPHPPPLSPLLTLPLPNQHPSCSFTGEANSHLRAVGVPPWKPSASMCPWLDPHFTLASDQMRPYQKSFSGSSLIKQHPSFTPQVLPSLSAVHYCISKHPYLLTCHILINLLHPPALEEVPEPKNFACFVHWCLQDLEQCCLLLGV